MTSMAARVAALDEAGRRAFYAGLSRRELEALPFHWPFWARPDQLPPPGDWRTWLLLGGRGAGKTCTAAETVRAEAESGRRGHVAILGPTADAVRRVQVEGPSGILAVSPPWARPVYEPSVRRITWPNGAVAHTFSSEEPDRLRGLNADYA
jgi:phage terminase large subunit-like protein